MDLSRLQSVTYISSSSSNLTCGNIGSDGSLSISILDGLLTDELNAQQIDKSRLIRLNHARTRTFWES